MPGVPGQRSGPVPKRTDQRRRQNADPFGGVTTAPGAAEVEVPEADKGWHPLAARLYQALEDSGQSAFYEPSDWAIAALICEDISRALKPTPMIDAEGNIVLDKNGDIMMRTLPMRGASISAYLRAFQSLLATEGDRRRLRLELERPKPDGEQPADPSVPNIADYRNRLSG